MAPDAPRTADVGASSREATDCGICMRRLAAFRHPRVRCRVSVPGPLRSRLRLSPALQLCSPRGPGIDTRHCSAFLAPLPIQGETPVAALRSLLLRFPFLPIDAGAGADRVIGFFSRAYVVQNSAQLHALGIDSEPLNLDLAMLTTAASHFHGGGGGGGDDDDDAAAQPSAPLPIEESSSDDELSQEGEGQSEEEEGPAALEAVSEATSAGRLPAEHLRAARDAVYTLTYSVKPSRPRQWRLARWQSD